MLGRSADAETLLRLPVELVDAFELEFRRRWPDRVDPRVYGDEVLEHTLAQVRSDAAVYAAAKAVRRIVGYSKVADILTLPEPEQAAAARLVLRVARTLGTARLDDADPRVLTARTVEVWGCDARIGRGAVRGCAARALARRGAACRCPAALVARRRSRHPAVPRDKRCLCRETRWVSVSQHSERLSGRSGSTPGWMPDSAPGRKPDSTPGRMPTRQRVATAKRSSHSVISRWRRAAATSAPHAYMPWFATMSAGTSGTSAVAAT